MGRDSNRRSLGSCCFYSLREQESHLNVIARSLNNLPLLVNLIATKQSHIYDAFIKRLLRQQDHLFHRKVFYVPRNDVAVVRFALVGKAIFINRHCEELE